VEVVDPEDADGVVIIVVAVAEDMDNTMVAAATLAPLPYYDPVRRLLRPETVPIPIVISHMW
jgi:hypothetical protein